MQLDEHTQCLCAGCGHPVVAAHDCDRQYAENESAKPRSNMEYFVRLIGSGN